MRNLSTSVLFSVLSLLPVLSGCDSAGKQSQKVVVYSSMDEEFAEPLAKQFEKETGVESCSFVTRRRPRAAVCSTGCSKKRSGPNATFSSAKTRCVRPFLKEKGISAPYQSRVGERIAAGVLRPRSSLDRNVGARPRSAGQ